MNNHTKSIIRSLRKTVLHLQARIEILKSEKSDLEAQVEDLESALWSARERARAAAESAREAESRALAERRAAEESFWNIREAADQLEQFYRRGDESGIRRQIKMLSEI